MSVLQCNICTEVNSDFWTLVFRALKAPAAVSAEHAAVRSGGIAGSPDVELLLSG